MTGKRLPSHSAAVAIKAMVNAAKGPIEVPAHVRLRDGDVPFWTGILASRARDEWMPADLVVAAQLARCQADIETQSALLDDEGMTAINKRGTEVLNVRCNALEQLARREMALMRSLRMGGKESGNGRDDRAGARVERQSAAVRDELADDELLAI